MHGVGYSVTWKHFSVAGSEGQDMWKESLKIF